MKISTLLLGLIGIWTGGWLGITGPPFWGRVFVAVVLFALIIYRDDVLERETLEMEITKRRLKMGTTKEMLQEWFEEGKEQGMDHMIVACDTFDYEDYPVYSKGAVDFQKDYERVTGANMQRVMEVYNLNLDMQEQLAEERAFHFPSETSLHMHRIK